MTTLISLRAAAKQSGIPYWTLLRLIHELKLPAVRIPGRRAMLIDPVDIEHFIASAKSGVEDGSFNHSQPQQVVDPTRQRKTKDSAAGKWDQPYYERYAVKPSA